MKKINKTLNNLIVDLEKQDWEVRELMEHNTGVSRETPIKKLKLMAEEISYGDVDNNAKVLPLYFGWIEALSWMKEVIEHEKERK